MAIARVLSVTRESVVARVEGCCGNSQSGIRDKRERFFGHGCTVGCCGNR